MKVETSSLKPPLSSLLSSVCTPLLNEGSGWEMSTALTHTLHSAGCFPAPTELPHRIGRLEKLWSFPTEMYNPFQSTENKVAEKVLKF